MSELRGRVPGASGRSLCAMRAAGRRRTPAPEVVALQGVRTADLLTAGSALHRTRRPLPVWFGAAYLVTTQTPGLSAGQLQRQLGLSDETAWARLHKLRRPWSTSSENRSRTRPRSTKPTWAVRREACREAANGWSRR